MDEQKYETLSFRLVSKGFMLHFRDGQVLVCPWSRVESFYFIEREARFILRNGKVYSHDFKDDKKLFKRAYRSYFEHSND